MSATATIRSARADPCGIDSAWLEAPWDRTPILYSMASLTTD
jgi:hypothetical protein